MRPFYVQYVRLVDFNMSDLLDPPMETETSAESFKMDSIMIRYELWSHVVVHLNIVDAAVWDTKSHKVNIKPQQVFAPMLIQLKLLSICPCKGILHCYRALWSIHQKREEKSNE